MIGTQEVSGLIQSGDTGDTPMPKLTAMQKPTMTLAQAAAYCRAWAKRRGSYAPGRSALNHAISRGRLKATPRIVLTQELPVWLVSESDLLDYLLSRRQDRRPGPLPAREGHEPDEAERSDDTMLVGASHFNAEL